MSYFIIININPILLWLPLLGEGGERGRDVENRTLYYFHYLFQTLTTTNYKLPTINYKL